MVAEPDFYQSYSDNHNEALQQIIAEDSGLSALLDSAVFDDKINTIVGYSANVKSLYGKAYALLGNAGEFLDPVFSSGVTIAMKSASLAAAVLDKQFKNETVDWQKDYAETLQRGVNTFRAYVDAWYDGRFQDIIFYDKPQQADIKAMISSILAGYAWDQANPYVKNAHSRLNTLVELCRDSD